MTMIGVFLPLGIQWSLLVAKRFPSLNIMKLRLKRDNGITSNHFHSPKPFKMPKSTWPSIPCRMPQPHKVNPMWVHLSKNWIVITQAKLANWIVFNSLCHLGKQLLAIDGLNLWESSRSQHVSNDTIAT